MRLNPAAFWPRPEVDSVMLRMEMRSDVVLSAPCRQCLRNLVRGCFNHRRKTMQSNLKTLLSEKQFARVQETGRWNLNDRPERITPEQWLDLANYLIDEYSLKT